MDPIPETTDVVDEFGPFTDDDLIADLRQMGDQVRRLVPDCLGLSVTSNEEGVTFTLVASAEEIALLDALQYLGGGPCVESAKQRRRLEYVPSDPLDEDDWQLFAQGFAASGVASSLSLPILDHDDVVGSVNLYGASRRAFVGLHDELADIFGAWAPGAVTNADLSFSSRATAEQAPAKLRAELMVDVAVGIIASAEEVGIEEAQELLRSAARRAGVTEAQLARTIVELGRHRDA